ncbi:MAG: LysM peptidoglycan-binding domain-containing protein, partial [Candidatus Binatia bacterium]
MVVLMFLLAGSCAAYTAIDLPYRADIKADYQTDESIERGALLYANNCRGCHGDRGQGGVGLPLSTDAYQNPASVLELEQNREKLRTTLHCGRLGTFMQPWLNTNGGSLNNVQIEHLINLITDSTGAGWDHAVEFSHNLNHESVAVVGGDTVATIAKTFRIGMAELAALNPSLPENGFLPKGAKVKLPDGRIYKTTQSSETFAKIADKQAVGAAILTDLNAGSIEPGKTYSYSFDTKTGTFVLLVNGDPAVGLFPGAVLSLPDDISYAVVDTDTVAIIAAKTGATVDEIKALNPDLADVGDQTALTEQAGMVLQLPPIATYEVRGQSVAELAGAFGGLRDAVQAFADENGFDPNNVLRIGQTLKIPPDAWGVTPSGTPNNGTACIEHAVPASVNADLTGASKPPEPPAQLSTDVEIVAHA